MFDGLIETLENGVVVVDTNFNIIAHNRAWNVQWGFAPNKCFNGEQYFKTLKIDPDMRSEHWDKALTGISMERKHQRHYSQALQKDVDLDWSLKPLVAKDGTVSAIVCNVKILKPIEKELRKERAERERLAYALAGSSDGIWDWDFISGSVYFSERYCGILGYKQDEIDHNFETWEQLVHPSDLDDAKSTITAYINDGKESYHNRFRMMAKDGSIRWILSRGQVVEYSADGTPRRLAGTHTDISDQVELEGQLILAKQQAEDAAEAERIFLSTMSHEIRTPLSGMIGMLDTLVGSTLDDGDREKLTLARQSSGTLLGILNSILNLSELKSGTFELVKKDFNLKEMFERGVAIYGSKAREKGINVDIDVKPSANRWANSDPERITQVLYNLVSNAIKFSDGGTITVTVSCVDSDTVANGMDLQLDVRDEGIGIAPSERKRVFGRFYQIDKGLERSFQGSGLGLHIVNEIIQAMEGDIQIDSVVGQGTCVNVSLPIMIGQYAAETVTPVRGIQELKKKHILVAEDISVNMRILTHYLKKIGIEYSCVSDGEEAVEASKRQDFDLILMDIQMPKMTGVEATEIIRARGGRNETMPIIALTANVFAQDVQTYFDSGITGHLAKPFTSSELTEVLKRYLLSPKKPPSKAPLKQLKVAEPLLEPTMAASA